MSLPTVAGVPTDVLFTSCFCFEPVRRSEDRTISPVRRFEGLSPAGRSPTPSRASESLISGECAPKKDARGDRSPSSLAADVEPSPARGLSDERVVLRSIEFFVFICWLPARSCSFCGDRPDSSAVLPPLESSVPSGTLLPLLPMLSSGDLLSGDDVEHCSPDAGSAVPGSRTLMSASLSAVYDQHRRRRKGIRKMCKESARATTLPALSAARRDRGRVPLPSTHPPRLLLSVNHSLHGVRSRSLPPT